MKWKTKALDAMAVENCWNRDRHTLFILGELAKKTAFPGEAYALRRAMRIVKNRAKC